jgi:hypothetical protein
VQATKSKESGGEASGGIAVSTGYGDCVYPVFVRRGEDCRIMQVLIDFELDDSIRRTEEAGR